MARPLLIRLGLAVALALFVLGAFGSISGAATPVGKTAADAIPIPSSGRFVGVVWPSSSTWYEFTHVAEQTTTVWIAYLPTDSVKTDLGVYSGTPDNLVQDTAASERYTYILYHRFNAHDRGEVFLRVMNDHPDRAISFVGQVEPSSALQGASPASVPIIRATADTPDVAIDAATGVFLGALAPQQTIWHRFYYNTPGALASVAADFLPTSGNGRLDVYTGPDVGHLRQQVDAPIARSDLTIVRQVQLPSAQWVYFAAFNGSQSIPLAYAGLAFPAFPPPEAVTTAPPPPPDPASQPPPAP